MNLSPVKVFSAVNLLASVVSYRLGNLETLLALVGVALIALYFYSSSSDASSSSAAVEKKKPVEFKTRISTAKTNSTGGTEYKIDTIYDGCSFSTWRSYSEFHRLKRRTHDVDPSFPNKSTVLQSLGNGDRTLAFIEKRKSGLNAFLKRIAPTKKDFEALVADHVSKEFFGVPSSLHVSGGTLPIEDVIDVAVKSIEMTLDISKYAVGQGGDGWKHHKTSSDGISCYLKTEGEFTYGMGVGTVNASVNQVALLLGSEEVRKDWDDLFDSEEILEEPLEYDPSADKETKNTFDFLQNWPLELK